MLELEGQFSFCITNITQQRIRHYYNSARNQLINTSNRFYVVASYCKIHIQNLWYRPIINIVLINCASQLHDLQFCFYFAILSSINVCKIENISNKIAICLKWLTNTSLFKILYVFKCFWKKSLIKNTKIVKYYHNLKSLFSILIYFKCYYFLWCKTAFSASLLQCHMIL